MLYSKGVAFGSYPVDVPLKKRYFFLLTDQYGAPISCGGFFRKGGDVRIAGM